MLAPSVALQYLPTVALKPRLKRLDYYGHAVREYARCAGLRSAEKERPPRWGARAALKFNKGWGTLWGQKPLSTYAAEIVSHDDDSRLS